MGVRHLTPESREYMLHLSDSYFEDEIREGFYVPAEIKQCWGAEIEVLNEIDRVCKKHGLNYFACWGTLLGAMRHGGMIPWDDDFDIVMLRQDYEMFMSVWKSEFPEGFDVINYKTHPDHIYFVSNVVGKSRICFEKDHLNRFHNFPYIAGVDIFVMDNMASDEENEKSRMKIADFIVTVADKIYEGTLSGAEAETNLALIEQSTKVKINRKLKGVELRIHMYTIAESFFKAIPDENSSKVTQIMPWGIQGRPYIFDRSDFDNVVYLPFENGSIPVPARYANMIQLSYRGGYMKIYKNGGAHDYPFFDKQKEDLQKVLDFEMPGFRLSKDDIASIRNRQAKKGNSEYRAVALEATDEISKMIGEAAEIAKKGNAVNEEILGEIQQLAIDLGTYIERVKGEEYITVSKLEELCEIVYQYSISKEEALIDRMRSIVAAVESDIHNRQEIVFMPFSSRNWKALEQDYLRELSDPNADVYVVAIPYYYKNYDETLRDMQYSIDNYPAQIHVYRYDEFDFESRHPDRIYIQYPYDQYNKTTGILPRFYSINLIDKTDNLIYIPWFTTTEFDKTDARAYKNMRYYCCMPGVCYSDMTYVPSENMRRMYIDKLCDFAGEDTRDIWEDKIKVSSIKEIENQLCDGGSKPDKKTLLYMVDYASLVENNLAAIDKIEHVLDTLKEAHIENGLNICWHEQPTVSIYLKEKNPELWEKYAILRDRFIDEGWGVYDSFADAIREKDSYGPLYKEHINHLVDSCTAYYGDAGWVAHLFRNAGKPVMIQNYEIRV